MTPAPTGILTFWRESGYDRWFGKDAAFDAEIRTRFGDMQTAAAQGDLTDWEDADEGALALVIALDQFPRNLFRDMPQAFATDAKARAIAHRDIIARFGRFPHRNAILGRVTTPDEQAYLDAGGFKG